MTAKLRLFFVCYLAQQIDEAVAELVPREGQYPLSPALWGQRVLSLPATSAGRISISFVEYENVNIAEPQDIGRRTSVTIAFNRADCH